MKKNNKTCILCGKKYTFCNRCEEFDRLPRWMGIYCSDNCRAIFNILTDYNGGHITKEEAIQKLNDCDLSYRDHFNKFNKGIIDNLMGVENDEESIDMAQHINAPIENVEIDNASQPSKHKRMKVAAKK